MFFYSEHLSLEKKTPEIHYHIGFYQNVVYKERSNDGMGNTMDVNNEEYLSTYGSGFNFGLGIIVKPIKNLRLGASFQ